MSEGNWVVNRNSVPFCAIGDDHAVEHVNRVMKVSGGIVEITRNQSALTWFESLVPQLTSRMQSATTNLVLFQVLTSPQVRCCYHQRRVIFYALWRH